MVDVYRATNEINGHAYIGVSTLGMLVRRGNHIAASRNGSNLVFHKAIRRYGADAFRWEILEQHKTEAAALAAEVRLIASLSPRYNMTKGGRGTGGLSHSEETKKRQSAAATGRKQSQEAIAKMRATRAANGGWGMSADARRKSRASLTGHVVTDETRAKISAANKGKKQSAAAIEKSRQARLGKKRSPEALAKFSAAMKGRSLSDNHKSAISLANRGKTHTAEAKAKMSVAHKGKPKLALRGLKRSAQTIANMREVGLANRDAWLLRSHLGPAALSRPVMCVSDHTVFPSASAAARHYRINKSALIELCLGKRGRKTVGGKLFSYLTLGDDHVAP